MVTAPLERLVATCQEALEHYPGASVARNEVGNLFVVTEDGVIAWLDLIGGGVHEFTW